MKAGIRGAILALIGMMAVAPAVADVADYGSAIRYFGTGTNDNDLLFTTGSTIRYSACMLMSTAGAVDVEASLDGTNFSTAAISLQDFGATTNDKVLVTAQLRMYALPGKYLAVRVRQNGATAASASLLCWPYGAT